MLQRRARPADARAAASGAGRKKLSRNSAKSPGIPAPRTPSAAGARNRNGACVRESRGQENERFRDGLHAPALPPLRPGGEHDDRRARAQPLGCLQCALGAGHRQRRRGGLRRHAVPVLGRCLAAGALLRRLRRDLRRRGRGRHPDPERARHPGDRLRQPRVRQRYGRHRRADLGRDRLRRRGGPGRFRALRRHELPLSRGQHRLLGGSEPRRSRGRGPSARLGDPELHRADRGRRDRHGRRRGAPAVGRVRATTSS